LTLAASSCGGIGTTPDLQQYARLPAGLTTLNLTTIDQLTGGPCSVSTDGLIWYKLPSGSLPPVDFTSAKCSAAATVSGFLPPALPIWSRPAATTNAIFVATSLQEAYSFAGMQGIESDAHGAGLPVTWLVGNPTYLTANSGYYSQVHAENGDDVELEDSRALYRLAAQLLPWYSPAVSVEGAGHERDIASAIALGNSAFWGITWNSHGTDATSDEGAPWGSYCADVKSYKRPSPTGNCSLLAFEWAARDLTRAYLTDTNSMGYSAEAAYSTIPEDVLQRGGFDTIAGAQYVRDIVDTYAAAGADEPLVMISEFESADEGTHGSRDDDILTALYGEAKNVGMHAMTLRSAVSAARLFSARPRAIAFPFISGGNPTQYNGKPIAPATIDFHDNQAGMTFISGHTLPSRVFEYAQDPISLFNQPLALLDQNAYPAVTAVTVSHGSLNIAFDAPAAIHFGVAIWTDPTSLQLTGANITRAGHAGFVATFDLPAGRSMTTIVCGKCTSTVFPFSL
jgi:hypothetical protein